MMQYACVCILVCEKRENVNVFKQCVFCNRKATRTYTANLCTPQRIFNVQHSARLISDFELRLAQSHKHSFKLPPLSCLHERILPRMEILQLRQKSHRFKTKKHKQPLVRTSHALYTLVFTQHTLGSPYRSHKLI